jgi:predicted ATPase/transcriptional regulator with XRE-family HTH domain
MGNPEAPEFFGEWLKQQRKKLDLTQEELARRVGCTVFALRKIEAGERKPSKQLAGLLAEALEIPLENQPTFVRVARGELSLERLRPLGVSAKPDVGEKPAPTPPQVHLPLSHANLVGRESELAAMERIFREPNCRLLTLTGPGGIGKTRLAIEFAACHVALFPGGIFYVPLASLDTPRLIIPAIADAIGLAFSGPMEPKAQLISFISNHLHHKALLVLDNLEHLLARPADNPVEAGEMGAAHIVAELLQHLPDIYILATSRERLNLHEEWTYELHGLPVPSMELIHDLEKYGAADLFIQSARRVRADFSVTEIERPAILHICQFVEGSPLAIELAAVWVGVLSCAEIAQEIENNLDLLATEMVDIPERHRSLRATFNHSWKLLSTAEKNTLQQLSVFHGGFDRQAAAQIAGASLAQLASLVAKSLVRRTETGRYDLHEVIQQYAYANLTQDPDWSPARDRHCAYYLGMLHTKEKALKSADQQETLRLLVQEMDNIRIAWDWGIQRELYDIVGAATRSLGWLFETAGLLQEGIDLFEMVIQDVQGKLLEPAAQQALGQALAQQSLLYFRKGEFLTAQTHLEESLRLLRPLGKPGLLADALVYLGVILHLNGELGRAMGLFRQALDCARAAGDEWFEAYALFNQGYVAHMLGDHPAGQEQMMAGMATWLRLGDPHSIALGWNFLAPALIQLGKYAEAQTHLQESLALCAETGNRWGAGTAYRYLGKTYLAQGNYVEAQSLIKTSLEVFSGYTIGWDIAISTNYLAEAILKAGDVTKAEETYRQGFNVAVECNSDPLALDALFGLAQIRIIQKQNRQAVQLLSFVVAQPGCSRETHAAAWALLGKLEEAMTPLEFETARGMAVRHSMETISEVLAET